MIETYTTWAIRNGKSAAYLGHPTSVGRKFLRRSPPLTRRSILMDAGFRQVSNDGLLNDCTQRTEQRGQVLKPRTAVQKFLAKEGHDFENGEAVYYRDPADCYGLIVWMK